MIRKSENRSILIVGLGVIFFLIAFLTFHIIYKYRVATDSLAQQLIGMGISAIVSLVTMNIIITMQKEKDIQKEFFATLFEKKIEIYEKYLEFIFRMDDDNLIEQREIQEVENQTGVIALVAGKELVSVLSQFVVQLKVYGIIYERSMTDKQREHFKVYMIENKNLGMKFKESHAKFDKNDKFGIAGYFVSVDDVVQAIREDLSVVSGDVENMLEGFVMLEYDKFNMIKDPNKVD